MKGEAFKSVKEQGALEVTIAHLRVVSTARIAPNTKKLVMLNMEAFQQHTVSLLSSRHYAIPFS